MLDPTIPLQAQTPGQWQAQSNANLESRMGLATAAQKYKQSAQSFPLEQQKAQQDLQTGQLNQAMQKIESASQIMQGATDQNSWEAAKQQVESIIPGGSARIPAMFSLDNQKAILNQAVDAKTKIQAQAMAAYRGAQLELKKDALNKGVGGWNPMTMRWENPDGTPYDVGGEQPAPQSGAQPLPPVSTAVSGAGQPLPAAATMPIPAAPVGGAATLPPALPVSSGQLGGGAMPPVAGFKDPQQDPVQASKDAIAAQQAQTGVSPAQRPDLANLPAAQVANMPVNGAPQPVAAQPTAPQVANTPAQRIGETTQQYRMRLQSQGIGSTSPVIYAANRIMQDAAKAGNPAPYETALSIAKKGLQEGQTFDVNTGQVGNIAGATDATAKMAQAKDEGAQYGKGLGEQMDQYRTVAQAAQGMDATLNAMKADSQNFRMGAMSDMQGTAKSYLQAIAQGLGVPTPEMDTSLGAQQAFTKSAMGLVMGGMQKVQGRAFGEMKAIQSAFPTQAMSQGGFDLVTNQIAGTNQYSEAMYQAAQNYKTQNGTLDGFESNFQKNLSPWAYVVKNMDPQSLGALSKSLSATPEGQKELHTIADQIDFATKNGLMQ